MKHFRKVCAVLLAVLMVAVILPSTGMLSVTTKAAGVAELLNGDFSEVETLTHNSGGNWYHALYWDQYEWGVNCSSNAAVFTQDTSTAGHIGLAQTVAVNTNATYTLTFKVKGGKSSNCTYTPCFTYKVLGGTKGDATNVTLASGTPSSGSSYTSNSVTIETKTYKYIAIQFINTGDGGGDSTLDDVALTVVDAGDTDTHAKPSFIDFGNELNRPKTSSDNVVVQPSFEATTNADWNTSTFIKSNLSVAADPDAKDGDKVLLYNNPTSTESWHYFELELPSGGNYVLSAWVKFPYLSATNQGTASIGLIDPDTNMFFMSTLADYKGHISTPFQQIRPTATDNEWHLRSITFFVGSASSVKIGVYGKMSTLYIDDISVHLETAGQKYTGDQTGTITASNNTSNMYCASADNLIPDCNMTGAVGKKFWTFAASGWNNGFMNYNEDDQRLEFAGTSPASNQAYNYIKWVNVEPGTKYTVSFDYRVMTGANTGQLRFIDNNVDKPQVFKTYSFSSATNNMTTTSFTFNSGNYNRIGIMFTDGASKAYFDDFRIFKTEDGISTEPADELVVNPDMKPYETGKSRMEMTEGKLGLAFRFNLECTGVTINEQFIADYSAGKVVPFNDDASSYKLVTAGAVMTNDATVGEDVDAFVRENTSTATGSKVIDVNATKMFGDYHKEYYGDPESGVVYAVRIVNIPESHSQTKIYARPYYVFEYKGKQITMYGDVVVDSYEPMKDVNDGWLEWD